MDGWTRRTLLARAGMIAAGAPLVGAARIAWAAAPPDVPVISAPPLTDADYLALADRIMNRLNHTWIRHKQAYSGGTRHGVIYNAALLTVHATAAQAGHAGRSRNDARARALVDALSAAPPFYVG